MANIKLKDIVQTESKKTNKASINEGSLFGMFINLLTKNKQKAGINDILQNKDVQTKFKDMKQSMDKVEQIRTELKDKYGFDLPKIDVTY